MLIHSRLPLVWFLLLVGGVTVAQDAASAVRDRLRQQQTLLGLTTKDATDWTVTSSSTDKKGITYLYIEQTAHGLPIHGAVASFAVRSGEVVSFGDRLCRDASGKAPSPVPALSATDALRSAAASLGLPATERHVQRVLSTHHLVLDGAGISLDPIAAKLVYEVVPDGRIALAWDLTIRSINGNNWWHVAVDAHTGTIVRNNDYIQHCAVAPIGPTAYHALDDLAVPPTPPGSGAAYRVFPFPTESPSHGPHTLVTTPADPLASPFGWHDVNGIEGAEFTTTRGNNVQAYEDMDNDELPGYSPDGGSSLNFDFPYESAQQPQEYLDAAVTNLFYTCNVLHDVWYHYGFDEESGNFQTFNASGSGAGDDAVIAQAQDGGGMNNANFGTPPDGSPGQMQMYLWRTTADSNLTITSPGSIAGAYFTVLAGFGPVLPEVPITAGIVLVEDEWEPINDGCDVLMNGDDIAGNIALVDRGLCNFVDKVYALQDAGALAAIVVNNVPGAPVAMGGDGGEGIFIPSVMISQADGVTLKQAIEAGPVNGTLQSLGPDEVRDPDFDNGIIAHEYGHGVSTRLTGGPDNSDCLWNAEQMGEGWSDWMALMLTMRPGDEGSTIRGMGTFVRDQETDGTGIRPAPYSTDLSINDYTYAATNDPSLSEPHGIGFVWATMLWDLNWALIEEHGWDPDVYNGTGGNNKAIQLMMDGLKLQPCNPGFVDGRDAILRADTLNYGAEHACLIWNAFAQRGLGFSADQGDPFSRDDQTEAFDLPAACSVGISGIPSTRPELSLIPNPARDRVTLVVPRTPQGEASVRIHSAEGRLVSSLPWPKGAVRLDLDLSGLDPALYSVEVRSSAGASQARLVVQ